MRHASHSGACWWILLWALLMVSAAAQTNVVFPDPNLEAAVRAALGRPTGELTDADLQGLTFLSAYNAQITDLSGLERATNLTMLYLGGNAIHNLGPLQNLRDLTALFLFNNRVTDLSPLGGLTNLTFLELRQNPITNFDALTGGLTNLTSLYLGGNSISNVGFLQPLRRLNLLNLDHNSVADPSPLGTLPGLSTLDLSYNPLTNFGGIGRFTNLTSLNLSGIAISNLTFLTNLTGLSSLFLYHDGVSDVSPLGGLRNLVALSLAGNPLTNCTVLGALTNLESLWLYGDTVTELGFIQPLRKLAYLYLQSNHIADLSPISMLIQLRVLNLSDNLIMDSSPLSGLTNLVNLGLASNTISNLAFVQGLTGLSSLDLNDNRISDLSPLTNLAGLNNLDLGKNLVTDIRPLKALPQLGWADLRWNLLDLSPDSDPMIVIRNLQHTTVYYLPQNQPPSISAPSFWPIASSTTSVFSFSVSDDLTRSDKLIVTASSSNAGLIANASLLLGGTNSDRTLAITPASNQVGTATITLTVIDGAGLSGDATVHVTVMAPQLVAIPDPNLEAAIRSALGEPAGELSNVELLKLTGLYAYNADITDLSGLEWATNLVTLDLSGSAITDLGPLGALGGLRSLFLYGNLVSDLSPLAGLTNLSSLDLGANPITNYEPMLTGFSHLTTLSLEGNSISNLAFLENLMQLTRLDLNKNRIVDLTPLAGLTNLSFLDLQQNRLSDLAPLGDLQSLFYLNARLNLLDTDAASLPMAEIRALQARGVTVDYLPQRGPPAIGVPVNCFFAANVTSWLPFTLQDNAGAASQFVISAISSDSTLMPSAGLVVTHDPIGDWSLAVTPASNQTGTATITLTATNDAGLVGSAVVVVTVAAPLPLSGGLSSYANLNWRTGGDAPWFGQTHVTHSGMSAAQSGSIGNSSESWLETTVTGPGILTFWWKVSSEEGYDWLEFYLNEVLQPTRISGEVDWEQQVVTVPIGTNTLRWRYAKDEGVSRGLDAGWLDEVSFKPLSWLELAAGPTNGRCRLILHPVPGRLYYVLTSTNLATWVSLAVFVATNNTMPFLDSAAGARSRFYRLLEVPASLIYFETPMRVVSGIQLVLHSPPGLQFELQASTDFTNWSGLAVVRNKLGSVQYTDQATTNLSSRFYRAKVLP